MSQTPEERLAVLETEMKDVRSDVKDIQADVKTVLAALNGLRGGKKVIWMLWTVAAVVLGYVGSFFHGAGPR